MSEKTKGILTGIGIYFGMGILIVISALLGLELTDGGWGTLGIVFIMVGITVLILIGAFIYGIVLYKQKQSQFGLGLIYGISGVAGYILLSELILQLVNIVG